MKTRRLVDGILIRSTLDDDFGILHTHATSINTFSPKFYIPEGELWIDHRFKDEVDFFMKAEAFALPDPTASYQTIRTAMKETFCKRGKIPSYVVTRLKNTEGIDICMVDGSIVRNYLDPEFIFGGHHFVYEYIPINEIWIEIKTDPQEVPYILEHERVERTHMQQGMSYDSAHEYATVADKILRRKDGYAYPGEENYPWRGLTNEQIITHYYVTTN